MSDAIVSWDTAGGQTQPREVAPGPAAGLRLKRRSWCRRRRDRFGACGRSTYSWRPERRRSDDPSPMRSVCAGGDEQVPRPGPDPRESPRSCHVAERRSRSRSICLRSVMSAAWVKNTDAAFRARRAGGGGDVLSHRRIMPARGSPTQIRRLGDEQAAGTSRTSECCCARPAIGGFVRWICGEPLMLVEPSVSSWSYVKEVVRPRRTSSRGADEPLPDRTQRRGSW